MIYWYADYPNQPARFTYDDKQFKRDWSSIDKVVSEISREKVFPLTEDENYCRFCTYRSYCERGKQPGTRDEADDEFESNNSFDVNFEQIWSPEGQNEEFGSGTEQYTINPSSILFL